MSNQSERRGPDRILFIRHAEEHETPGFTGDGVPDEQSLTVRGWQRAGALVRRFCPDGGSGELTPGTVFASGLGPESWSLRPNQTIEPLLALLETKGRVETCFTHLKHETEALMADVVTRSGTVLVAWEHSQIAKCVGSLANVSAHPDKWPDERYDLVWRLDRTGEGWRFSQEGQMVLAGDAPP